MTWGLLLQTVPPGWQTDVMNRLPDLTEVGHGPVVQGSEARGPTPPPHPRELRPGDVCLLPLALRPSCRDVQPKALLYVPALHACGAEVKDPCRRALAPTDTNRTATQTPLHTTVITSSLQRVKINHYEVSKRLKRGH